MSRNKVSVWLVLILCLLTGALGWAGHHFFRAPSEARAALELFQADTPPPADLANLTPIPASEGLFFWNGTQLVAFEIEPEPCEPVEVVRWQTRDCPEILPPVCPTCPECRICPTCPEPEVVVKRVEVFAQPNILIGFERDFTEVACYYDDNGVAIEAARLDLSSELDIQDPPDPEDLEAPALPLWSARLGWAEQSGVDFGLSRRFSRRWGGYVGARWLTDPEEVLRWPTREDHNSGGSELRWYREDDVSFAAGLEVAW